MSHCHLLPFSIFIIDINEISMSKYLQDVSHSLNFNIKKKNIKYLIVCLLTPLMLTGYIPYIYREDHLILKFCL